MTKSSTNHPGWWIVAASIITAIVLFTSDYLERRRNKIDVFRTTVTAYAGEIQDRYVSAGMVAYAIQRGASGQSDIEEVRRRKVRYDKSYLTTNATIFSHTLKVSPVFSRTSQGRILQRYMVQVIPDDLTKIDTYVTNAYGKLIETKDFSAALKEMGAPYRTVRGRAEACLSALVKQVDYIYREPSPFFFEVWKWGNRISADELDARLGEKCN